MEYIKIPMVEKKVSRIFYGTAGQPLMMGGDANDLLDGIYALGSMRLILQETTC